MGVMVVYITHWDWLMVKLGDLRHNGAGGHLVDTACAITAVHAVITLRERRKKLMKEQSATAYRPLT